MYTICYIVFFVLSTLAAFKNDTRKLNALYRQPNTVYSAAFITACSHTTKMQKTGYSFCYALFFMAESEGFGSLRSPSSLLRKLSYYRLLLTRLRLAKDCKGSNPVFTFKQKTGHSFCYALFFMANDFNFNTMHPLWKLEGALWVRGCKANGAVHIVNYIIFYNDSLIISYVLIAQLDRVFGYEPKGQGFEPWEGERRWENSPADCF